MPYHSVIFQLFICKVKLSLRGMILIYFLFSHRHDEASGTTEQVSPCIWTSGEK